jgi:hypothetical protein
MVVSVQSMVVVVAVACAAMAKLLGVTEGLVAEGLWLRSEK